MTERAQKDAEHRCNGGAADTRRNGPEKRAASAASVAAASQALLVATAMKLSIRQGLLLLIVLASLTLAAVTGVGMWGTWRGQESLRRVLFEEVEPTQRLIEIDKLLSGLPARFYGVLNNDFGVHGVRTSLLEAQKEAPLAWQHYLQTMAAVASIDEQNLIDTIDGGMAELPAMLDHFERLLAVNDMAAIAHLLKEDWWAIHLQVVAPVRQLIARQQEHVAETYATAQDVYRQTLLGTALLVTFGLALFLLFARQLFRYVNHKLGVIEEGLRRIAKGDLETRIGGSHRGEFGRIVVALDRTADTLREDRAAIAVLQQRQASILESMADGRWALRYRRQRPHQLLQCRRRTPAWLERRRGPRQRIAPPIPPLAVGRNAISGRTMPTLRDADSPGSVLFGRGDVLAQGRQQLSGRVRWLTNRCRRTDRRHGGHFS